MKPITLLQRGDLFQPDYDPAKVYVFCERVGQDYCTVRRVAFLMDGVWHTTEGQQENYRSDAQVMPVTMRFKRENL